MGSADANHANLPSYSLQVLTLTFVMSNCWGQHVFVFGFGLENRTGKLKCQVPHWISWLACLENGSWSQITDFELNGTWLIHPCFCHYRVVVVVVVVFSKKSLLRASKHIRNSLITRTSVRRFVWVLITEIAGFHHWPRTQSVQAISQFRKEPISLIELAALTILHIWVNEKAANPDRTVI